MSARRYFMLLFAMVLWMLAYLSYMWIYQSFPQYQHTNAWIFTGTDHKDHGNASLEI